MPGVRKETELIRGRFFRGFLALHQFHVQAKRLQLADQDVERFGHARLDARLALDDGLVNFRAAVNVVRLRGQQFLKDVRRAVRLERPDFHFAEALSAELRLAAERLLRDERVRPDGPRVDFVVDEVREFEHVDVADGDRLAEFLARHAVPQRDFPRVGQARHFEQVADFGFARAVKHGRSHRDAFAEAVGVFEQRVVVEIGERLPDGRVGKHFAEPAAQGVGLLVLIEQACDAAAQFFRRPSEVRFENLSDVHTRRNAERIQDDFHRGAVRQIRHVFFRNDSRDDTLVAVAAGHFVADRKFALHGDVALHQLDDAGRKLVALAELFLALLGNFPKHVDLARGHLLDLIDFLDEQRVLVGEAQPLEVARRDFFDDVTRELRALGDQAFVRFFVVQVGGERFAFKQHGKTLEALVGEDADFVRQVLFELEHLRGLDGLVAFVFFGALAAENLYVHDGAFDARRAVEGSVAHIAGLFAEDRAQQFFFRRQRGFALWSDLANQDVSGAHGRANADHAAFIEVAKKHFADVGNIARDFLRAEFRVPRFDFVFLDVNGSIVVVLDQLFADQDGVLEVVPAPGHERDQDVAAQRQFPAIGARAVGQHLPLPDAVSHADERLLVDAGVLVGTLEFDELV